MRKLMLENEIVSCISVYLYIIVGLVIIYSVSQKKTSPTFLAVTRQSIVGFS